MAKYEFKTDDDMIVKAFNDSMAYEIVHALGVPLYDNWDYSRWEYINFARAAHARILYDFFEARGVSGREAKKEYLLVDDVVCSD